MFDIVNSQNVAPGTAEFNALDLNNDGLLTIADYAQFNAFFGQFTGPQAGLNIGAYGYYNDGVWVDFVYDNLDPEDYFGKVGLRQDIQKQEGHPHHLHHEKTS